MKQEFGHSFERYLFHSDKPTVLNNSLWQMVGANLLLALISTYDHLTQKLYSKND